MQDEAWRDNEVTRNIMQREEVVFSGGGSQYSSYDDDDVDAIGNYSTV